MLAEEELGQRENLLGSFSQRRQADREDVEAEKQVTPEAARFDFRIEIPMRRRDEPDIDLDLRDATHPTEPSPFEHLEELGLDRRFHLSDLVQKQRAAVGHLEQTEFPGRGARESPSFMTEQLRLRQLPAQTGAVQLDERFVRAGRGLVDHAREHSCLLYTSDAADERSSVDLGGRRIIKKKKKRE